MSFSVSKHRGERKRLARVRGPVDDFEATPTTQPMAATISTDIYIAPYTPKSFVVMGETLNHSNALIELGGKYNTNLRIGQGWIFAKVRQESVEHYIKTGEVKPYRYSNTEINRFKQQQAPPADSTTSTKQLRKLFSELRGAFDVNEEYEGQSILDALYQFEEKYLPKNASKESSKKSSRTREETQKPKTRQPRLARPAPEPEPEQQMDSEDDDNDESEAEYADTEWTPHDSDSD